MLHTFCVELGGFGVAANNRAVGIKWPWVLNKHLENFCGSEQTLHSFKVAFVLVQAGSAALGLSEGGDIVQHKVIKKYMVRKKQGKAQLKHLKTKGKSRLGSRIRLQQTQKFFNEIHEKLEEWDASSKANSILFSASGTIWPLLFSSVKQPAFNQRDERLVKVPLDLDEPNFKVLQYVNKTAHKTIVKVEDEEIIEKLIPFLANHNIHHQLS